MVLRNTIFLIEVTIFFNEDNFLEIQCRVILLNIKCLIYALYHFGCVGIPDEVDFTIK